VSFLQDVILKDRYRIIRLLNEGWFGAVYRAEDIVNDVDVAIKEVSLSNGIEDQSLSRLADHLIGLHHPHLTRVTDYFTNPPQGSYLVMEFIEGIDLQTLLESGSITLDTNIQYEWIDQISDALEYLHSQSPPIVHCDIKPTNIRIMHNGKAKLVDFGLAMQVDPNIESSNRVYGVSPGYSPPELYRNFPIDERTDQYAVGATLYTLITGIRPVESIARSRGKVLAEPHDLNSDVPTAIEQVTMRALQLQPEERFSTITEFREALSQAVEDINRDT
jgi:serine/threonine protein kinase